MKYLILLTALFLISCKKSDVASFTSGEDDYPDYSFVYGHKLLEATDDEVVFCVEIISGVYARNGSHTGFPVQLYYDLNSCLIYNSTSHELAFGPGHTYEDVARGIKYTTTIVGPFFYINVEEL